MKNEILTWLSDTWDYVIARKYIIKNRKGQESRKHPKIRIYSSYFNLLQSSGFLICFYQTNYWGNYLISPHHFQHLINKL